MLSLVSRIVIALYSGVFVVECACCGVCDYSGVCDCNAVALYATVSLRHYCCTTVVPH